MRKVLILSVPSDKEEKSALVDFATDVDCSSAVVEIRVPNLIKTEEHADFREFTMVKSILICD